MRHLIIALLLVLGVCAGCDARKSIEFNVTSMAVVSKSNSVIFTFSTDAQHDALVLRGVKEDVVEDLAAFLLRYRNNITNAVTHAEVWDVKFLRSPQHTAKTYHVAIRLDRPLGPSEVGRGFSLDGAYDSISFAEQKEVERLLVNGTAVQLHGIPHKLHYMSRKVRSPGKHVPGP